MTESMSILDQLQASLEQGLQELGALGDEAGLQAWKSAHLGKSSAVMQAFSGLGSIDKSLRPAVGQRANQVKLALEAAYAERAQAVKETALAQSLQAQRLDVTLPGRPPELGRLHPQTQTMREIIRVFGEMGFQVFDSPEVETDDYNFGWLNIPAHHPARDMYDTFHTTRPGVLLRTHTSPGQIRAMRELAPEPIRVVLPGMCYRYEQTDARHEFQFTQVEVLAVGRNLTLSDLKGTLVDFARRMFGEQARVRFRPSYFPFTEPSGDMEVECFVCGGEGCAICKSSGWLEILGCGMVHPTVLANGGYDPNEFTGFAAGLGPERVSILRHRIEDIRYFWANDIRFLDQF